MLMTFESEFIGPGSENINSYLVRHLFHSFEFSIFVYINIFIYI